MKIFTLSLLFSFGPLAVMAQTTDRKVEPEGGIERLALVYYSIDFSREQRKQLEEVELEFIYLVDTTGNATLQEVNGTSDRAILDSLFSKKELPRFTTLQGKVKERSFYFMKLKFPYYQTMKRYQPASRFGRFAMSDLEDVERSRVRIDVLLGAIGNAFAGPISEFLAPGGGMKADLLVKVNKTGYGMGLAFCGNYMKKDYPLNTTREVSSAPPIGFFAIIISREIFRHERSELNIQFEPAVASQTISASKFRGDDYIQSNGFSPGIIVNYFTRIGKESFTAQWSGASIQSHYINFHGGIRPLFMSIKPTRGVMIELGLSYRLTGQFVNSYSLRDQ